MDEAEYELWDAANRIAPRSARARRPCSDCPLSFFIEMRAAGCCDGTPQMRLRGPVTHDRLREQWAMAQRRRRMRRKLSTAVPQTLGTSALTQG